MPAPLVAAGIKLLPFAIAAFQQWFGGRRQNQAARRAHDAQYNSPQRLARNAYLTQLWNQHNLADRFKDAFPDPATLAPGTMGKTPENVLRARIEAPRFEGGGGPGLLDSLLGNIHRLPMPGQEEEEEEDGSSTTGATGIDEFSSSTDYQVPTILDPFRYRRQRG